MTQLHFISFVLCAFLAMKTSSEYKDIGLDFSPSPRDPRSIYSNGKNQELKDERFFYYHFTPPPEKKRKTKSYEKISKKNGKPGILQNFPERRIELIFVNLDKPYPEPAVVPPPKRKLQIYLLDDQKKYSQHKYIEAPEAPKHVPEVFFLRSFRKPTKHSLSMRPFKYLRDLHHLNNDEHHNALHESEKLYKDVENLYHLHENAELKKLPLPISNHENHQNNYPIPPPFGGSVRFSSQNIDFTSPKSLIEYENQAFDSPPAPAFVLPPGYADAEKGF